MTTATLLCKTNRQSQWRETEIRKETEGGDKNENPEGKTAKVMKSAKKEIICSGSLLSSLRATNTSIITDA